MIDLALAILLLVASPVDNAVVFADGFESGDAREWEGPAFCHALDFSLCEDPACVCAVVFVDGCWWVAVLCQ